MNWVYRLSVAVALGFAVISTVNAGTPVQDLQQKLQSFQGLRANFQQALYGDKRQPAAKSSGKMAVQRPGKFRWETLSPNEQVLVADGDLLWIYDIDLEQATKQQVDTTDSNSPALFLSGNVSEIPKRFTVTAENPAVGEAYKLVAKSADDMFQSITIVFTAGKLSKMVVQTRIGQRCEFAFNQVELNPTFTPSTFHFKPPTGVDVLTN